MQNFDFAIVFYGGKRDSVKVIGVAEFKIYRLRHRKSPRSQEKYDSIIWRVKK
jgi:hypothetical protein